MDADRNKVFKALAAPERRVLLINCEPTTVQTLGQLCQHLDMTRQAVTRHLKLLEEANLVATVWRGREKLHYLNPMPILDIAERGLADEARAATGAGGAEGKTGRRRKCLNRNLCM